MSEACDDPHEWKDENYETLFANIGKYVVIFQSIEALVDQLLLLAWGQNNWAGSQRRLAGMTNDRKIRTLASEVLGSSDFKRVHTRPDWVSHFQTVVERLHSERQFRNSLVHSQILFEFAEKGLGPPLLSFRAKEGSDAKFDRRWLTKEFQNEMLQQVGRLCFDMNFVYMQLLHDFQAHA
jgi:hypothetical protein